MAAYPDWAGEKYNQPGPEPALEPDPACPYHLWDGPGHSEPFRDCPGDREREAG